MGDQELRAIFSETGPDFTAEIVPNASMRDLELTAIQEFQKRWHRKNPSLKLDSLQPDQVLKNAELIIDDEITYAALILLGKPSAISRYLAQAEVIFEYRSSEAAGPASDREEYREPFLLFYDRLWNKINLRNDRQSYQDDFFATIFPPLTKPPFAKPYLTPSVIEIIVQGAQYSFVSIPDVWKSSVLVGFRQV